MVWLFSLGTGRFDSKHFFKVNMQTEWESKTVFQDIIINIYFQLGFFFFFPLAVPIACESPEAMGWNLSQAVTRLDP